MSGVAMPPGDPDAMDQAAAGIGRAAAGAGGLATATHQVTTAVVADAEWTGQAADACTAFTSGLTRGVGKMQAPLARVPAVVGAYAAALRAAQARVAACQGYTAQAGPGVMLDPATLAALENDAGAALAALEQAAQAARAFTERDGRRGQIGSSTVRKHCVQPLTGSPWSTSAAGGDHQEESVITAAAARGATCRGGTLRWIR